MNREEKKERIFGVDCRQDNNTWKTGLNNNDIIIGSSGAGKTRGYVIPNILNESDSFIVADTKGNLYNQTKRALRQKGYRIIRLNFTDCKKSTHGYNPLAYIRYDDTRECYEEQDIIRIAACLAPGVSAHDPFWDMAARMYLECVMAYVLECCPEEEHNMDTVIQLFEVKTHDECIFDTLLSELALHKPDSFAVRRYRMICGNQAANKMHASIHGILASQLAPLSFGGVKGILQAENNVNLTSLGDEKTAVFLDISDTDRSMDNLINLFYTQAFQELCRHADNMPDSRLKVPIRFFMDDFASNTVIPDFDKIISVIRSREISVSLIIQSLSQLQSLYGKAKMQTIMNNCDNCLYLGGQDVETAKYFAVKANKSMSSLLNMPLDAAWLFTHGREPRSIQKYDMEK